jgi:hypothetical protein
MPLGFVTHYYREEAVLVNVFAICDRFEHQRRFHRSLNMLTGLCFCFSRGGDDDGRGGGGGGGAFLFGVIVIIGVVVCALTHDDKSGMMSP